MHVQADWDKPINRDGDTLRSLLEEFEQSPSCDLHGTEIVSMTFSKSNRDAFAAAVRALLSLAIPEETKTFKVGSVVQW